jgi:hypothetical protein
MALGNLDIHTMEKIDNFNPDKVTLPVGYPETILLSTTLKMSYNYAINLTRGVKLILIQGPHTAHLISIGPDL